MAIITTSALLPGRTLGGSRLQKGAGAVAAVPAATVDVEYFKAVEQPNGFNNVLDKLTNKSNVTKNNTNNVISKFTSDDDEF
jgi:hypothetical protein